MPAVHTNLAIEQGVTWAHGWAVTYAGTAIDDTWQARAQIRSHVTEPGLLHTFAASVDAAGNVVITVDAAESSAWTWRSGVYDLEVFDPSTPPITLRVAQGTVSVDPEVTR